MELKDFILSDGNNVIAEILTQSGPIRVEAEILGTTLPVQIDRLTWVENGADAAMDISRHLDEVRDLIEAEANKALA